MQSGKSTKKTKKSTAESPEAIRELDSPKTAKRAVKPLATSPAPAKESAIPAPTTTKPRATSAERPLHRAAKPAPVLVEPKREAPLAMAAAAGTSKEGAIGIGAPRPLTHDDIAKLAYSYWLARGQQGGNQYEDWIRAERELRAAGKRLRA